MPEASPAVQTGEVSQGEAALHLHTALQAATGSAGTLGQIPA